ncbi:RDS1 [Sanghuangporus weigelae]
MVLSGFESLAVLPLLLAIHHVCAVPVRTGNTSAAPPPVGGLTENPPAYVPLSDFDFQSLNLGLNQEYMELDLFNFALQRFNSDEFAATGLGPNDEALIAFMASQEVGHATALTNILGEKSAAKPCNFSWPVKTVPDFIDLSQRITRIGESGVFGFLNKLNSRSSAQILTQSISTESRQQLIFRQWEGLFPMPVWFEPSITQSMQWTLMAPYFTSCPASNPKIKWNNFPALNITNSSSAHQFSHPAIAPNVSAGLSSPGQTVHFSFEAPGKAVGPNSSFVTVTNTTGSPRFAAWISQLNVTYTELADVSVGRGNETGTASTIQPGGTVFQGEDDPIVNGTMFIVLTDSNPFVTPFNVSELDAHVVAGPVVYQSG